MSSFNVGSGSKQSFDSRHPSPGGYGHHAAAPPAPPVPYAQPKQKYGAPPACAANTTALGASWCLLDGEYPTYDVQHAIEYHYAAVAALYKVCGLPSEP